MRWHCSVLAGLVLAGLPPAAMAQDAPVETVTVTTRASGPALWHATKNGADVTILGTIEPLPDNFTWNTKPLEAILPAMRQVLLPPRVRMGLFSGAWFYLTESDLLHPPGNRTLRDVLDPQVASDLAKMCQFLHEPTDRYSQNSPVLAAIRLGSDFRHVAYLTTHEPEDSIVALARARRVSVRRIATYDLVPTADELLELPPAETGKCIEAAIQDIKFQREHVQAAANAWAIGDVAAIMANRSPSHTYECFVRSSPHAIELDARSIDDTVAAIDAALADGGHVLVIADIDLMSRRDGILDRLRVSGISLSRP